MYAELEFYVASSPKQQSACRTTRTHYSDSEPTSLCNLSLMFLAYRRSNKYQFYIFGFILPGLEPMIYRTPGKHANQYAPNAVPQVFKGSDIFSINIIILNAFQIW